MQELRAVEGQGGFMLLYTQPADQPYGVNTNIQNVLNTGIL